MEFAGVKITQDTIIATRQWFADNAQACIESARDGTNTVNDLASYIEWQKEAAADSLAGNYDCTFTFMQRAHYIQTGESIPLLR